MDVIKTKRIGPYSIELVQWDWRESDMEYELQSWNKEELMDDIGLNCSKKIALKNFDLWVKDAQKMIMRELAEGI